jgi:hypothetical protein
MQGKAGGREPSQEVTTTAVIRDVTDHKKTEIGFKFGGRVSLGFCFI